MSYLSTAKNRCTTYRYSRKRNEMMRMRNDKANVRFIICVRSCRNVNVMRIRMKQDEYSGPFSALFFVHSFVHGERKIYYTSLRIDIQLHLIPEYVLKLLNIV